MVQLVKMKNLKIFSISVLAVALLLRANGGFCQPGFHVYYSMSSPGLGTMSSGDASSDAAYEVARRLNAYYASQFAAYQRSVARFDRKLVISSNVVKKMDAGAKSAAKYPRALALYKKSYEGYQKLEPMSQQFANHQIPLEKCEPEQKDIIDQSVKAYHQGTDLIELGDQKTQMLKTATNDFVVQHSLTPDEKTQLKQLEEQIATAEQQIEKYTQNVKDVNHLTEFARSQTAETIQGLAKCLETYGKLMEKLFGLALPDKTVKAVEITQSIAENYIEEAVANDKPFSTAISEALQQEYDALKIETVAGATPQLHKWTSAPLKLKAALESLAKWQETFKNRAETIRIVNNVIATAEDGIRTNQNIIDRSNAKGKLIIDKAITRYLNTTKP